jgi:hypothetical protein
VGSASNLNDKRTATAKCLALAKRSKPPVSFPGTKFGAGDSAMGSWGEGSGLALVRAGLWAADSETWWVKGWAEAWARGWVVEKTKASHAVGKKSRRFGN